MPGARGGKLKRILKIFDEKLYKKFRNSTKG
jgi:hypothetical protein